MKPPRHHHKFGYWTLILVNKKETWKKQCWECGKAEFKPREVK